MRKSILFTLVALLCFSIQMSAEPVSLEKAQTEAREFLQSIGAQVGELTLVDAPVKVSPSREESVYYYVFNFGEDGGFIIISGDDRTQPVLGYSQEGHVGAEEISNYMRPMLETYKEELDKVETMEMVAYSGPRHVQTPSSSPVDPMLTCHWSQLSPYNSQSPTVSGSLCSPGCLPVAIAQILYYFRNRLPAKLPTKIPAYTTKTYRYSISSVAAGTAFNWGSMVDELTSANSTQIKAVASIIAYVGKAMVSDYGLSATSTPWTNVPSALPKYFGMSSDITMLKRKSYSNDRWRQVLNSELEANRPVLIYAENHDGGAHAFVIDGCDGGDMFHVNWGWGRGDGYFLLSVMNCLQPNDEEAQVSSEKSFNKNMLAYIGLQPVQGYTEPVEDITLMSTINSASSNVTKLTFKNKSESKRKYTAGVGFLDENKRAQLLQKWTLGSSAIEPGASVTGVTFTLKTTDFTSKGLGKGTHKLYPIYKVEGDEDWRLCDQSSTLSYVKADVTTSSVSLSKVESTPSFTVSDVAFPGSHGKNYKQFVTFKVTNVGDEGIGTLYLYASKSTTYGSAASRVEIALGAGESANVQMHFLPTSAATYNILITDGKNTLKTAKVTIVSLTSSAVYALVTAGYHIDNLKDGSSTVFYGDILKGSVTVKNSGSKDYAGYVSVYLYKLSGSSYVSTLMRKEHYLELKAGASQNLDFYFDNLSYSLKYGLFVIYEDTRGFIKPYNYGYKPTQGVILYKADGSSTAQAAASTLTVPSGIVAVDISGVTSTISKVTSNANPNTLFFMNSSETAPSGLSGKNVVKGDKASTINLTDGYDFYVPKRFTATDITFSRTPSIGTGGSGGWTSIVMPFDVTQVTVNGEQISWFKSETDYGKNFWVKEFQGISGENTVCFGYAQEMKANNPYIMAVPNSKWGSQYNLVGKKIVFHGKNALLVKDPSVLVGTDLMNFRGTYATLNTTNTYVLNSTGTKFSFGSNKVKPFYGFFVAKDLDLFGVGDLNISSFEEEEANGILRLFEEDTNEKVDVYSVNGMKVGTTEMQNGKVNLDNLPKGIYIIKGKKVVR